VLIESGNHTTAASVLRETLQLWSDLGDVIQLTATLDALARLVWSCGEKERARRLLSAARTIRQQLGVRMNPDSHMWLLRWLPQAEQGDISKPASRLRLQDVMTLAVAETERLQSGGTLTLHDKGGLTHREVEVVSQISQGLTNAEIARRLHVSERTIHAHVRNVLAKLGVRSRAAVAGWAVRHTFTALGDDESRRAPSSVQLVGSKSAILPVTPVVDAIIMGDAPHIRL
jgi:DNA-binding CsgD family transcriptional regulator